MAYENSTSRPPLNTVLNRLYAFAESDNIAADIKKRDDGLRLLAEIGSKVHTGFEIDLRSRSSWEETAKKSMEAALQVRQPKSYPFPGASNVKWPLITVAALQFNARSYPEICSPDGPVRGRVVGSDEGVPQVDQSGQPVVDPQTGEPQWQVPPGAKKERAERVAEHMSYQLTKEMDGWESDMDTLLMQLPIIGDVVKKVYRGDDTNVSDLIPAMDFVVNQKTKSLSKAPRATHVIKLYPHEIEERKLDGRFLDVELGTPANEGEGDPDAPHEFLEQHCRCDLDEDGYGEPYIVTMHRESHEVVRIVANYEQEDVKSDGKRILKITPSDYFVNYIFIPDPEGGFYGIGFGRLLESLGAAIDTTINQMLDAGHLQNAGGGFIGSGVRLKKSMLRMEPGVYHTVRSTGDNLRNAIVNMEHPGPSTVLFQLLGLMIDVSKDITAVKDVLTGDTGTKGAVQPTTVLAQIEQGLKVFTAIYQRIYRSLEHEFKLLARLNSRYLSDEEYYTVLDEQKAIAKADYNQSDYDVCPVADPKVVTDMQRLARANALLGTYQINSNPEILRRYYAAIGAEDVEALLPQQDPQQAQLASAAAELEVAGLAADVDKTKAETAETMSSIEDDKAKLGLEKERLDLDAIEAVDESLRADEQLIQSQRNADEDRKAKKKAA